MSGHLQLFNRWRCITHDCGSYNFNNLVRHEIPSCDILTEETVGVVKPKTWGGQNGDVSRGHIQEFLDEIRNKQIQDNAIKNWFRYRKKAAREYYLDKYPRTYDKKLKRLFTNKRKNNKRR